MNCIHYLTWGLEGNRNGRYLQGEADVDREELRCGQAGECLVKSIFQSCIRSVNGEQEIQQAEQVDLWKLCHRKRARAGHEKNISYHTLFFKKVNGLKVRQNYPIGDNIAALLHHTRPYIFHLLWWKNHQSRRLWSKGKPAEQPSSTLLVLDGALRVF